MLAQTVNEKGTSQIEATRLAQDTTNSKLSASTNIIYYYYATNLTKVSLDPNCRPPLTKTN